MLHFGFCTHESAHGGYESAPFTRCCRGGWQGTRGGAQVSLLNIITELKKCCNHPVCPKLSLISSHLAHESSVEACLCHGMIILAPVCQSVSHSGCGACTHHLHGAPQFLFDSAETDFRGSEGDVNAVDRLIVTSGKMVLLDKLLRRLKETGHRLGMSFAIHSAAAVDNCGFS